MEKQIKIESLSLTNWKGEASRTIEFCNGVTTIAGGNGLGKTRTRDALLWLLTGNFLL